MMIDHSSHAHPTPIPMEIPMPTAAMEVTAPIEECGNADSAW